MNFKNTKTKNLMWVPNVLKFLIRTRINIIRFDNIVGIDRVGIMWMGIDSGGKWSGGIWSVGFDLGGKWSGGKWSGGIWFGWELCDWEMIRWDLIWVGIDRVGIVRALELNGFQYLLEIFLCKTTLFQLKKYLLIIKVKKKQ